MAESFFAAAASAGATSPLVLSLFVTGVVFQSALFSQVVEQVGVAGQPFPVRPLRGAGHLLRGADGFPLGGRNHSDQIAFHDHLRVGKAGLVQFAGGHQRGAERLRMHHARVQHAGQPHIGGPLSRER